MHIDYGENPQRHLQLVVGTSLRSMCPRPGLLLDSSREGPQGQEDPDLAENADLGGGMYLQQT